MNNRIRDRDFLKRPEMEKEIPSNQSTGARLKPGARNIRVDTSNHGR